MRERIVVLDGAMGTMIQGYKLSEADYRGDRLRDWKGKDLKGSLELLNLMQPQVIEEIHSNYLEAGADIIETNTFSGMNNHRLERFSVSKRTYKWLQRSGILSAWWTMSVSGDSAYELILKPRDRVTHALRTGPQMKVASSDCWRINGAASSRAHFT